MFGVTPTPNPPRTKPIKMVCDDVSDSKIQFPLPNRGGARFLIVGPPGSGKSNWAVSQLIKGGSYHHVFDALHVVMPLNSRASFAQDPFEKHDKNYSELSEEVLAKILVDVKEMAATGGNSCVFLDDVAYTLKEKPIERLLRELFFNARHLRCCIFLVSQTLRSIPSKVRLAASHLLSFESANRLEANIMASEFICLDPQSAGALFAQCFNKNMTTCSFTRAKGESFVTLTKPNSPDHSSYHPPPRHLSASIGSQWLRVVFERAGCRPRARWSPWSMEGVRGDRHLAAFLFF